MKIMVLAGGYDQIAFIDKLKRRGHEIVLLDYLSNPVAKNHADLFCQISTLDEAGVLKCALEQKVGLITTACTDQALLTVARVSEQLSLPCYITSETAQNVTDKVYMKEIFRRNTIPSAEWILVDSSMHVDDSEINKMDFPLVVKPCDCNSSKGITKVYVKENLESAIRNALLLSRSKKVIVESYIHGDEISIDTWNGDQGVQILAVSGTHKIQSNDKEFTIYQSSYPVELSAALKRKIQQIAEKIAASFRLHNCPMLIQAIKKGDEVYVIEFSARIGGGSKYKLIEYISGVDVLECYVDRILDWPVQTVMPRQSDKYIELDYIYAENGIFGKMKNFKELLDTKKIKEIFYYKNHGDVIEKRTTSSDRIAGVLLEENTYDDLMQIRKDVIDQVDVLDIDGKSIMYKDCFISEEM